MLQTRSAKRTAAAAVKIAVDMVDEGTITQGGGGRPDRAGPGRPAPPRDSSTRARSRARSGSSRASTRRPAPPSGGRCSTPTTPSSGSAAARRSSSSGSRPRRTTSTAWPSPRASSPPAAAPPRTPRSSPARSASRASPAAPSCSSTTARRAPAATRQRPRASRKATGSASTARPARSSSARCRPSRRGSRTSPSSRRSSAGPTRSAGWASGRTPTSREEAAQARSYGAQGIGLCRTEHMFREGERLEIVRGAILVASVATRAKAKAAAGGELSADEQRRRRDVRCRDGQARGAPAGRLRGDLQGDGRPAGRHPPDRPAAPRVPAEPRGAARQGHAGGGARAARSDEDKELLATIRSRSTSRTRCSGCAAAASG